MKLYIKFLLFMILLCPISIFALVDYQSATNLVNNYIVNVNKDILYIVNADGRFQYSLLSANEFNIESSYRGSYLSNNGLEFWTSSSAQGGKVYVIREGLSSKETIEKSNVRVVARLKENVVVSGSGTLNDPWYFQDMIKIEFSINNKFDSNSYLSPVSCNQSMSGSDIVTVYYTPGGKNLNVYFCSDENFRPSISSCDLNPFIQLVQENGNKNKYIISNITKDDIKDKDKLSCLIDFIPE